MLKAFSGLKTRCAKCRSVDISILHCKQPYPQTRFFGGHTCADEEHFHRGCKACGFEWLEAVPVDETTEAVGE